MKYNKKIWFFLPMRSLLFIAAFYFCSLITKRDLTEITHWWTIIASAINIVTIIVLWIIFKQSNTAPPDNGIYKYSMAEFTGGLPFYLYTKSNIQRTKVQRTKVQRTKVQRTKVLGKLVSGKFLYRLIFTGIMLLIGIAGMYLAGWLCYGKFPYLAPMMIAPVPPFIAILNIFILPLTTTLAEEGIYLGYGVNSFTSKWAAVFIPAFFYALQHIFIPTIFDIKFITYRFLSFLPLTIWICLKYYKGASISYIMTGHLVLNIATTIQIVITSFNPEAYARMSGSV